MKTNMKTFPEALKVVLSGGRIARVGWNGANQFVTKIHAGNAVYTRRGLSAPMQDCLGLKNAQGNMQPGWVPSQGDMFAEDWVEV